MTSAGDLVADAHLYLGGARSFSELYDKALDVAAAGNGSPERGWPEGGAPPFVRDLAGLVIEAEADESAGAGSRRETRLRIAEALKIEALAHLGAS